MPPRKRAAGGKAGGKGAKVAKKEPDDGGLKAAVEKLKTADQGKKASHTVDSHCGVAGTVLDDYDCMLNQTNIGDNNNKYYVIQLVTANSNYHVFTRWGRVGESGMKDTKGFGADLEGATKLFCKKFQDKTKNKWDNRADFEPKAGKYTLIEVEEADEEEVLVTSDKAGGKGAKVAKKEPDDGGLKAAVEKLKTAEKGKKASHTVDSHCGVAGTVLDDYDCMLNQTNIGDNNNKYYVIQLVTANSNYHVFTRWGRVGESGMKDTKGFGADLEGATKLFCKKFQDKTKNKWDNRADFEPKAGKYTLIEVEEADEEEVLGTSDKAGGEGSIKKVQASKLDSATQDFVKLVFNEDMFKEQMTKFEIDVKKMPLGKLSKAQLAKGFGALEELEQALQKKSSKAKLSELSSKFYTIIPHSFGRKIPPLIDDAEKIQGKKDMLVVLGDIELALGMQKEKKQIEAEAGDAIPHPLDVQYGLLKCKLELLDHSSEEFKILKTYTTNTGGQGVDKQLLHVWKMDREDEGDRFAAHKDITNRRLLWHGTNVAVVAAILKTGLRIMPHSGGRVGRGIYLASEQSKSRGYVGPANDGRAVMFLNEAALGKEHHITRNDGSLTKAPKGCDCVIAKGNQEPDPKKEAILKLDGKDVVVPQGKPVQQKEWSSSHFYQSEYLVYKESQNRMRYICLFKFW